MLNVNDEEPLPVVEAFFMDRIPVLNCFSNPKFGVITTFNGGEKCVQDRAGRFLV